MRPLVYSKTIIVRTDADLRAAVASAAEREGASASDWVRRALSAVVSTVPRPTHGGSQSAQASHLWMRLRTPSPASPATRPPSILTEISAGRIS